MLYIYAKQKFLSSNLYFLIMIKTWFTFFYSILKYGMVQLLSCTKGLAALYIVKEVCGKKALAYVKSLNWIVLLGIAAFCIALAIVNNLRVDEAKSVEWIGSQDVLAKPAEVL